MTYVRTPEDCPYPPDQLTVEFSRNHQNPKFTFVRFIVFEQEWYKDSRTGMNRVNRTVKDIVQFEDLRASTSLRRMKEYLRKYIKDSPGGVLENVSLLGDISDFGMGDEEVQVSVSNVRLTDHTLAVTEFALRHMVVSFMNRSVPETV